MGTLNLQTKWFIIDAARKWWFMYRENKMEESLKQYFTQDITGYYFDKKRNGYFLRGVAGVKRCTDRTRNDKAIKQAELSPVPFCKVYSYINEFLEMIRKSNGFSKENIKIDTIQLGNNKHTIIDNGIIIRENKWELPQGHMEGNRYVDDFHDEKYDVIKDKFSLERASDILWFKFTNKGHLAVVAGSYDINWNEESSCGILVNEIEEKFDDTFVFVFPLTQEMIRTKSEPNSYYRKYKSMELELAVGNYLINKGVPIVDFYSHMGHEFFDNN